MRIPYFRVSAFSSSPFGGNPAGVCPLESWLPDELLQKVATENNLSETAFFTKENNQFHLRWFTPAVEVDLCGHATLASAFVLLNELGWKEKTLRFSSRGGILSATQHDDVVELDFPARPAVPCPMPNELWQGLGAKPAEVLKARDYLAVFKTAEEVASLKPDMRLLNALDCLGIIVTAPGGGADFLSRFFAPRAGVPEDAVTGSAHCTLIPYWAQRLGKSELFAKQISRRGGELFCRNGGERVVIGGRAVVYCRGELQLSDA